MFKYVRMQIRLALHVAVYDECRIIDCQSFSIVFRMCRNLYYHIDENGGVVSDVKGKILTSRMRELMEIYFPDDILTDWRLQPEGSKDIVIDILHREFPNPLEYRFKTKVMKSAMNQALKSRRGTARTAGREGVRKPPGLSDDDWRRVHDEQRTFPHRWDQQREANKIQQQTIGVSHLGSGGKPNFLYKFVSPLLI